ncbi:histidine kinase [Leptospira congkakensis]|uniref:histidine kinase n=1 Tax=Leptospira congkakensis TaxID=2484932 RepID=A0A4Z1ANJ3_9LEPT|nr:MASE3 domain-containing protein [Leptospira congkakensis]TGL85256.1 histidine kinase [Leptospira congkakensis]TGL85353.1 histidine kinase [Leptospira congkakensis]TGL99903.1 histidine kinase [Leptospira congkakensis]
MLTILRKQLKNNSFFLWITVLCFVPLFLVGRFPEYFYREYEIGYFLVFHNITEIFSVIVSFSIFGLGYYSYSQSGNANTLFLGLGFLVVGSIDFMHTLGYTGMPDFITPNSGNKSSQFWIFSRLITAIVLFVAIYIKPNRKYKLIRENLLVWFALLLVLVIFLLVIVFPDWIPKTYEQGKGLTSFKKNAEYAIIGILFLSFFVYKKTTFCTSKKQLQYYLAAFVVCIFSEMVFAVYTSVYDVYNVIGHIYKIGAFYLIFKAVYIAAINDPYNQLIESNGLLSKEVEENKVYAEMIRKSLKEKENLIAEIFHRTKNSIQLVRSILMIQASDFPDDKNIQSIVEDTSIKIQTMSLVHDHLYANNDLSEIKVSDYLRSLVGMVRQVYPPSGKEINISFQVGEGTLLLDTAVPLGLVFTELLSNSFKYAFPNVRVGEVAIWFSFEGNVCNLEYSDNGVGLPEGFDLLKQKKLGLSLAKIIAEKQMEGTLSIDGTQGFRMKLSFPNNLYKRRV